jgi:hypothetical protein
VNDDAAVEGFTFPGAHSLLVEDRRDLVFGMVVQQAINFLNDACIGLPQFWCRARQWQRETLRLATLGAYMHRDVVRLDQGHIFQQQPDYAFLLTIRRFGVLP